MKIESNPKKTETPSVGLLDTTEHNLGNRSDSCLDSHAAISLNLISQNFRFINSTSTKINMTKMIIPDEDQKLFNIMLGCDTLLDQNLRVLCIPLGIPSQFPLPNEVLKNCKKGDTLVISPSGNKGYDTVLSPGIHPEVFCVGAVNKYGKIAPFSGRMYDEHGNCLKPEVCALGVDVEVELEDGSKHVVNGTSFACAQVAGVAAALFEANPEANVNDVKMALIESCTPAEGSRFGNINPEKALELIRTKTPYKEQFEPIPEPEWFDEQYIDYRLISQCKRARKNNKDVEGLVVGEDTDALIKRLENEMGEFLSEYHPFNNFDMAHIIAKPEFYDALFEQPDLEVASAVDINYFDM